LAFFLFFYSFLENFKVHRKGKEEVLIFLQKESWKDCNQRGEQGGDRRNPARAVAGSGERVREDQWARANLLVAEGERERAGEVAPRSSRGAAEQSSTASLFQRGWGAWAEVGWTESFDGVRENYSGG
jgi:hypothetical protein